MSELKTTSDITPSKIIKLAMSRLKARGKGILVLHDIHPATVAALPGLLKDLKDRGFRVVQVVAAAPQGNSKNLLTRDEARRIAANITKLASEWGEVGKIAEQTVTAKP